MTISALDFILLQFGTPGHYLVFLGFLICCLQLPIVFTEYVFKYYILVPPHRCRLSPTLTTMVNTGNQLWKDLNVHKNEWYPLVKIESPLLPRPLQLMNNYGSNMEQLLMIKSNASSSSQMFDQCSIYIDPVHHWKGKQSCPNGWEYWTPNNEQNLITEFNLVCENKYLLTILVNVVFVNSLLALLLFGLMADKFGRRTTLNLTIYLFVAAALSVYFVSDFIQFSIFYNLQIFFVNGLQLSAYVILLEMFPTPYQLKANVFWFAFRAMISILISVLICAIPDWRYMQLSIAVPSFAFITYLFVIPSSPLWQTVVKRNQQLAVKTLIHFSKFCGKPISVNQINLHIQNLYTSTINFATTTQIYEPITNSNLNLTQNANTNGNGSSSSSTRSGSRALTRQQQVKPNELSNIQQKLPSLSKPGPILRWYLLTNFYLFFLLTIINSELFDQHTLSLNPNQYIDSIYNTLIDLAFIILTYHLALWLGSRTIQSMLFFINGFLVVISLVLKEYLRNQSTVDIDSFDFRLLLLPPILMVIARSLGRCIFMFVTFHAIKSIPTNIRATGIGFCYFWAQVSKLSIPHLIVLSHYLPFNTLHFMFGILAIFSGIISLLFPTLENKPWPNTLIDLEERKNRINNSAINSSSKRYPSYRDLKTFTKGRSTSINDIYIVPQNTIPNDNNIRTSAEHHINNVNERNRICNDLPSSVGGIKNGENSLVSSDNSTKLETEKSSLSSAGGHNDNLIESTSNSFLAQIIQNPKTSYIPNNDIDSFILELNRKLNIN